jgi:capsular exopolysaccharide synthesis family protein
VSARSDEGRTTVAANLAEAMAQASDSVVLVDANLRQPAIHAMYGLDNAVGLASVLAGSATIDSALQSAGIARLSVLAAGPAPEDPSVLLGQGRLSGLVGELRSRFSWVIMDMAPGLAFIDALLASVAVDAVLFVVAAGEVVRGAEQRLLDDLEASGVRILGAVVNKVLPQHADALYHFGKAEAEAPEDDEPQT